MSDQRAHEPVWITGAGMISALGFDSANAMAASRAGLSRAAGLDYFPIKSTEDGELGLAIGHQAPGASRGFEGSARLLALAKAGFTDLCKMVDWQQLTIERTALYLALPYADRVFSGLQLVEPEETREAFQEEAKVEADRVVPDQVAFRTLKRLVSITQMPVSLKTSRYFLSGHCGAADALTAAILDLRAGSIDTAIVGGVDSLLDERTLAWLMSTGRLKTDEFAAGLQPAEAACFALLELPESANKRNAIGLGAVRQAISESESNTSYSMSPSTGKGVASLLQRIIEQTPELASQSLWIICDQNGEAYRGMEWGSAIVRSEAQPEKKDSIILWYPAMSFGDTAAASGLIGAFSALRAFDRGYHEAPNAVVLTGSDDGRRSAFIVSMAEH